MASNLSEGIAFQIRATRDKQKMSQTDLACEAGMTPNNLSRLESPDYGKQSIHSLKRIAEALDVALVVRFVPFSQYIDWLSGTPRIDEGLSPSSLAVPSFEEEAKKLFEVEAGQQPVPLVPSVVLVNAQSSVISASTYYAGNAVGKRITYEQSQPASVVKELAGVEELVRNGYISTPQPVIRGMHQSNFEERYATD